MKNKGEKRKKRKNYLYSNEHFLMLLLFEVSSLVKAASFSHFPKENTIYKTSAKVVGGKLRFKWVVKEG